MPSALRYNFTTFILIFLVFIFTPATYAQTPEEQKQARDQAEQKCLTQDPGLGADNKKEELASCILNNLPDFYNTNPSLKDQQTRAKSICGNSNYCVTQVMECYRQFGDNENSPEQNECVKKAIPQSTVSPSPASQSNTSNQIPLALGGRVITTDNYKAPQHSDYSINNLQHGLLCMLAGMSPVGGCVGVGQNGITYLYDKLPGGGAIGGLTTMTAMLYQPPTSTAQYIANISKEFGLVSPAYAQVTGSGADLIRPVELLWTVMRNLAYMVYIIIFLVIGFMIMLRQKLNAQTVISVQNALPGLVIGLILIYLSYFFSALIIDTAFFGIQLVGNVFNQIIDPKDPNKILNVFEPQGLATESNILHLFWSTLTKVPETGVNVGTGTTSTIQSTNMLGVGILAIVGSIVGTLLFPGALLAGIGVGTAVGFGVGGLAGPQLAGLALGLLLPIVLIIALIIQFFKLFLKLLNSYIMLLVTTILAPMFILVGTVPGQSKTIAFWWRNLLGHALTFPAVFAVFLFAGMILATNNWESAPPLFGGLSTILIKTLVAYGIILGLPAVPDLIKKFVGAQDLGAIGQTGLQGFMGGFGIVGKAGKEGLEKTPVGIGFKIRHALEEARQKDRAGIDIHDEFGKISSKIKEYDTEAKSLGFVRGLPQRIIANISKSGKLK